MQLATRRATLAGAALLAAGTVAAATLLRKPRVYAPVAAPDAEQIHLQDISALRPVDPPRSLSTITIADADGAAHPLADFAGRGLVLNLWATWCAPCVAEMPALAALAKAVAGEPILVLPVSLDRGGAAVVRRFYAEHGIEGLGVWLDPKGTAEAALGARGVPTTLLIDRAGRERARLEGAADWAAPAALDAIRKLVA